MGDIKNPIAIKLKELRESHGYTQDYIAANIEIKQPTYNQYETGKRKPGATILYKIANFYGLTTDELLRLCIPLDYDIYYEAQDETSRTLEEAELSSYAKSKNATGLKSAETTLLFYFSKLNNEAKNELIEYARFKAHQQKNTKK